MTINQKEVPVKDFHIIQTFEPRTGWSPASLLEGVNPIQRVRNSLGGRWTRSEGSLREDLAAAFWNGANGRRAFVIRLPRGMTRESALRVLNAKAGVGGGKVAA